jgi:peptide/nickel transport system substrate-binding protein
VILQELPTLANGEASLQPLEVSAGALIVDASGDLNNLKEGTSYLPSGCSDPSCAQTYPGSGTVSMDQLVAQFRLLPGLKWSDGSPLRADDSLYSYEVARSLYPQARPDLVARTDSYQALDETTVEWRGLPGWHDPQYAANFFVPLPRHAWGSIPPQDMLQAQAPTRMPIGWGPYRIVEWTAGDHITLERNPDYFRLAEGLPHFDTLVFRFVSSGDEALTALLAGECDYVDETGVLESQSDRLAELQEAGKIQVATGTGSAWESVTFNIAPLDPGSPALFQDQKTRQAFALCIDRERLVTELLAGKSRVPDSYVPPDHPLHNPAVRQYAFDPKAGAALLDTAGWADEDGDLNTPRVARGVSGVPDGTLLRVTYLTAAEADKERAAQIIQSSLAECGIQMEIRSHPWDELLAAGPGGPVFGRSFDLAQFGWVTAAEPPCSLYMSTEIPGPYPQHARGWGGANVGGFSDPAYDQACRAARNSLPDSDQHRAAHFEAQAIFASQLPALPLYLHLKQVAMRPDFCSVTFDPSSESSLWQIEAFDYGEACSTK